MADDAILQEMMFDDDEVKTERPPNFEEVQTMAREIWQAQEEVADLEAKLESKQQHLNALTRHDMIEALGDLNGFKMSNGFEVVLKDWWSCKDTPEGQEWLIGNDHGDVIKDVISIPFAREDHKKADECFALLEEKGYEPDRKMSVHNSTLKALLKKLDSEGKDFPRNLFHYQTGQVASVIKPKG